MEVQVPGMELELGVAGGNSCAFLVLGDEAEVGFACECWVRLVGTLWRVNPAAASDEAPIGGSTPE